MEDNNLDIEICDECTNEINCNKDGIFIIVKEEEEKVLCQYCFEDLWKDYSNDGWSGDDIEYYLELEKKKENQ